MADDSSPTSISDHLRRTHSSPTPPFVDVILVKVIFPSLECTKIFRLNPHNVSYEPLLKILAIAKVDEQEKKGFRLYSANGNIINPGSSLFACNIKDKDTLLFKPDEVVGKLNNDVPSSSISDAVRRSMSFSGGKPSSEFSLSSSTGEIRPLCAALPTASIISTNSHQSHTTGASAIATPTPLNVPVNSDYWGAVSSFIGSFLKRRPSVYDLPRHIYPHIHEMLDAPVVPQSHIIIACIAYLKEREAYTLEGIFRLSGLATEVRTVFDSFKQETFDLDWVKNPHTIATALKQYCRKSCIIPSTMCNPWVHLIREMKDDDEIFSIVSKGISSLPTENRIILTCLFSFMRLVLENQDSNKMAAHSLSVVWGPNLLHIQMPSVDAFSEANLQITIMHLILTHLDELRLWGDY